MLICAFLFSSAWRTSTYVTSIIPARLLWDQNLKSAEDRVAWMKKLEIFNFWDQDALNV
ncbi:hypothetical protein QR685DRAFT_530762 [Neurospora intermedia]|uniref:Uncharacterized protein n=1 Tax=Neurospora intermedia TaxID=5142 RepID=A0ABR3D914_NEUIN